MRVHSECGWRKLLRYKAGDGNHAAADNVLVFWNWDFNWTPLYSCPYLLSFPAWANFDLFQTFQNITTALVADKSWTVFCVFKFRFPLPRFLFFQLGTEERANNRRKLKYIFIYKWHDWRGHLSDVTECANDVPLRLIPVLFSDRHGSDWGDPWLWVATDNGWRICMAGMVKGGC